MAQVLFVDDDISTRKALSRLFRDSDVEIEIASSGAEALCALEREEVRAVFTDFKMPSMNGLELLEKVEHKFPDTLRVVLSAHSDTETLLRAINEGRVYRYILKPWDPHELLQTVRQVVYIHELRKERDKLMQQLSAQNEVLEQKVEERTRQLWRLNRSAELGKYASQIAHHLNTPIQNLSAEVLMAEMLLEDSAHGAKLGAHLSEMLDQLVGLRETVRTILLKSADSLFFREELLDLNEVIRRDLDYLKMDRQFGSAVRLRLSLAEQPVWVEANPAQIMQMIDIPVQNALEAMSEQPNPQLTLETAREGGYASLIVRDNGPGVSPEVLPELTSPDYTTKAEGNGNGLGLAILKRLVDSYGGELEIRSALRVGTEVKTLLPAPK
jgi:signal transduction histidine kinase